MGRPLDQHTQISGDTLQSAFPFIQQGGWKNTPAQHKSHASHGRHSQPASPTAIPHRPFPAELFADLTKREIQAVLEIMHYSIEAKTGDDVYQVLRLIQRVVACPRVIGGVARLNSKGTFGEFNNVINVSYSNDWLYTYCKNEYAAIDPVLQHLSSGTPTLIWEQTFAASTSQKQREFVEEARAYGLTNGITTWNVDRSRGIATFFSFAGGDASDAVRYKGILEYLVPYLHRVLATGTLLLSSIGSKGLSPREITVLLWIKEGKSNWEIAHIIGISERTVRFHVESIFLKLDTSSRTQAVAVAMERGLLPTA